MTKDTEKTRDPDGYAALLRAAQRARERARMHRVPLVISRDGKVAHIPPDEIEDLPPELLRIAHHETAGPSG